jgi:hypothetical protein
LLGLGERQNALADLAPELDNQERSRETAVSTIIRAEAAIECARRSPLLATDGSLSKQQ